MKREAVALRKDMQNSELSGSFIFSELNLLRSSKVPPARFPKLRLCAPARFSGRQASSRPASQPASHPLRGVHAVHSSLLIQTMHPRETPPSHPHHTPLPGPPLPQESPAALPNQNISMVTGQAFLTHVHRPPSLWKPLDVGEVLWCNFRGAGTPVTPPPSHPPSSPPAEFLIKLYQ